ncbi:hypothetical protein RB653_002021 [Dictyostelium firmibasis]|uniref:Transmembrane protein n=1 Tax=Dictyostelium firmibasis TaxID=79012 RepID=A0AAN7U7F3_9MYCE
MNNYNCPNITVFILICISSCILFVSLFTGWYYVTYTNKIVDEFSFYSTNIIQKSSYKESKNTISWSDFDLKNTHKIINTCLAFSIIAFILGILSIFAYYFKFRGHMTGSKRMPVVSRIGVILMFICTIISVSVLSGITSAFKKDLDGFNGGNNSTNTDSNDFKPFFYCNDSCDKKWSGEITNSIENSVTKFGPGPAFVIACCSLLPQLLSIPIAILFSIIPRI